MDGTGTIVINETEIGDTGLYQCVVETTLPNVSAPTLTTSSMISEVTVTCKSLVRQHHQGTSGLVYIKYGGWVMFVHEAGRGRGGMKVGGALVREGG